MSEIELDDKFKYALVQLLTRQNKSPSGFSVIECSNDLKGFNRKKYEENILKKINKYYSLEDENHQDKVAVIKETSGKLSKVFKYCK